MAHLVVKDPLNKFPDKITPKGTLVKYIDREYAVFTMAKFIEVPLAVNLLRDKDEILAFEYRDLYSDTVFRIFGDNVTEEEKAAFTPYFILPSEDVANEEPEAVERASDEPPKGEEPVFVP